MGDYEITFHNSDYSCPLDSEPIGANKMRIKAISDEDALTIFKTNNPRFKNSIESIAELM